MSCKDVDAAIRPVGADRLPEHFMVVITGDPLHISACMFGHNGPAQSLNFLVTRKIDV